LINNTIFDVLVIGSGVAGLSSAIEAKNIDNNLKIAVISKNKITSCGSVQAQGGINAVIKNNDLEDDEIECSTLLSQNIKNSDSVEQHIKDTLEASHGNGNIEAIRLMCQRAPKAIEFLQSVGVPFDKDDNGNYITRKMGGSSYPRTLHCSDYTGLKIVHSLYDRAINDDIEFLEYFQVLDLIIKDDICHGIVVLDIKTSDVQIIKTKSLIIASGGYASIYDGYTTNSNSNIGDMIAIASKNSIKISNMDKIQFHPTSLIKSKILMSEGARAEGGYLVNSDNERFIDELLPRDVVSKAVFEQIQNGKKVFIDVRHLTKEKIDNLIPQERLLCHRFEGVDIVDELVQITPSAHYTMGGISVNLEARTSVQNIFACGECADSGVHGDNRLGGNSLLEGVVFGLVAGKNAISFSHKSSEKKIDFEQILNHHKKEIDTIFEQSSSKNFYNTKKEIGKLCFEKFGIVRDVDTIDELRDYIQSVQDDIQSNNIYGISDKDRAFNSDLISYLEFESMVEVVLLCVNTTK
jgi:succinate dehydrogenase / fumarate reductase flavoprotein subunit